MARALILGPNGKPWRAEEPRELAAEQRYEAAETTDHNKEHWRWADGLSADGTNTLEVRRRLRERARYEVGCNNAYGRGLVETLANDLIGTGPRLRLVLDDPLLQDTLETRLGAMQVARDLHRAEIAFAKWLLAIGGAEKLRLMKKAKVVDGEAFGVFFTNDALADPVQLDLEVVECDRITDPITGRGEDLQNDGIRYDAVGNPVAYFVRNEHPGDMTFDFTGKWLPARFVCHWFRKDRPGQCRGVPEITTALPLFAQLRRWTLATLTAAEAAADIAGLLKSTLDPETGEVKQPQDWEAIKYRRGMLMCMPYGYELEQLDSKHPNERYKDFKRELLSEIARCVSMPYAIAAGDSSDSSYAGGRLEFQSWALANRVEQSHCDAAVVSRLFSAWIEEAVNVPQFLADWITPANVAASFFYDHRPHVDPSKEASADETNLRNHATTYAEIYAKRGLDWEEQLRQRAKEMSLMDELGLSVAPSAGPAPAQEPDPAPPRDNTDAQDVQDPEYADA